MGGGLEAVAWVAMEPAVEEWGLVMTGAVVAMAVEEVETMAVAWEDMMVVGAWVEHVVEVTTAEVMQGVEGMARVV